MDFLNHCIILFADICKRSHLSSDWQFMLLMIVVFYINSHGKLLVQSDYLAILL